jgi:hypothetical protein
VGLERTLTLVRPGIKVIPLVLEGARRLRSLHDLPAALTVLAVTVLVPCGEVHIPFVLVLSWEARHDGGLSIDEGEAGEDLLEEGFIAEADGVATARNEGHAPLNRDRRKGMAVGHTAHNDDWRFMLVSDVLDRDSRLRNNLERRRSDACLRRTLKYRGGVDDMVAGMREGLEIGANMLLDRLKLENGKNITGIEDTVEGRQLMHVHGSCRRISS